MLKDLNGKCFITKWISICTLLLCIAAATITAQTLKLKSEGINTSEATIKDTVEIRQRLRFADSILQINEADAAKVYSALLQSSLKLEYFYGASISSENLYLILQHKGDTKGMKDLSLYLLQYCSETNKLNQLLPDIYNGLGIYYLRQKDNGEAAVNFKTALDYQTKFNVKSTGKIEHNIGSVLMGQDNYEKAVYYFKIEESLARKSKDSIGLVYSLTEIGHCYLGMKQFEKAKDALTEARLVAEKTDIPKYEILVRILIGLGEYYLLQDDYKNALQSFKEIENSDIKMMPDDLFTVSSNMGYSYLGISNLPKAEQYFKKAISLNEENKLNEPSIYRGLAIVYEQMGLYRKSLEYFVKYHNLTDSISKDKYNNDFSNLEVRYRTAEKDKVLTKKELKISKQQIQLQRQGIWIITGGAFILIIISLSYGYYRRYKNRQKLQSQQMELIKQRRSMEIIQSMIAGEEKERGRIARELHDGIGGMLAAINMNVSAVQKRYIQMFNSPELDPIMKMVEDTALEVRKTAHNLMPDILMRNDFTEAIKLYCEQINSSRGLHINLIFATEISLLHKSVELVIYRIVQELIHNIVKHAKATESIVEIEQDNDRLHIIVEDNGIGFDKATQEEGFGLQQMQHRVESLQGSITIESAPGRGTTINIYFDLVALHNIMNNEY